MESSLDKEAFEGSRVTGWEIYCAQRIAGLDVAEKKRWKERK